MAYRVYPKIVDKIRVGIGGCHWPTRSAASSQTRHSLCSEQSPDVLDWAYYPELQDIRNHINKAKRSIQLSVALKVEQWKKKSPTANYVFRPFHQGSYFEVPEQSLLWVHKEVWQQDWYCDTITMIDATYKTTKYDLALFCVRQNQPWLAVAEFISRNECATTIQEALEVLKTWNPQWQPGLFMIVWLQWGRDRCHWNIIPRHSWIHLWLSQGTGLGKWVKDHITSSDADVLLDLLRACAWAPSTTPDEDGLKDCNLKAAVDNMKKSHIWKQNHQVQQWLTQMWLPVAKVECNYI